MEFDQPATTPDDLLAVWQLATEPHGWLGRPTSLTRYESSSRSELAGHEGCQLIAVGETGRELWFELPEGDSYERLSFAARPQFKGSIVEYDMVVSAVFASVGATPPAAPRRSWREVVRGRNPAPPEVINWP